MVLFEMQRTCSCHEDNETLAPAEYEELAIDKETIFPHCGIDSAMHEITDQSSGLSMFHLRNRISNRVQDFFEKENALPVSFEPTQNMTENKTEQSPAQFFDTGVEVDVVGLPISASSPKSEYTSMPFINLGGEKFTGCTNASENFWQDFSN